MVRHEGELRLAERNSVLSAQRTLRSFQSRLGGIVCNSTDDPNDDHDDEHDTPHDPYYRSRRSVRVSARGARAPAGCASARGATARCTV